MTSISTLLPTYATIDLAALAHNLSQIKRYLSPSCEVMAVVKANAYGHGAVETAQALSSQGVGRFAVASLDEGIALRHAGLSASIVVLGALLEEQVRDLVAYRLTPVVSDRLILPSLAKAAHSQLAPYPIHPRSKPGWDGWDFLRKSCSLSSTTQSFEALFISRD